MKVLITGVAGLLGSHFSRHLLDNGYMVIGVDNLFGGYEENIDKRIMWYNRNLDDYNNLQIIFEREKPDYVYHFAAYAAVGLSPFIRNFNYVNNILCSVNVVNCCIKFGVKKLIFSSSMDVYGDQVPPFTEVLTPQPMSPYGIAKYAVELDLKNANEQFGLNYTIIRPHNIIGIYQNIWDKYRNVIGIWIRKAINNEPLLIYGNGLHSRAFSDVKYYMKPFEQCMLNANTDKETINIGADKVYSLNDIASLVVKTAESFGIKAEVKHVESRHEVLHAFCNHDKAKKILSFKDETIAEIVIKDMFAWAMKQPNREVKIMKYEIDKGLYSFWK
jgi:UDP-glucose 4-epimerase